MDSPLEAPGGTNPAVSLILDLLASGTMRKNVKFVVICTEQLEINTDDIDSFEQWHLMANGDVDNNVT